MMLPFSFTHTVPKAEVRKRAERFEAEAGFLPWYDWTDFVDDAGAELLEELRSEAKRLDIREHEIRLDGFAAADGTRFTCSFINETDRMLFRLAV